MGRAYPVGTCDMCMCAMSHRPRRRTSTNVALPLNVTCSPVNDLLSTIMPVCTRPKAATAASPKMLTFGPVMR